MAIGGEDGAVRLLDLTSGRLRTAAGRHRAPVNEARFTPDGQTLVTVGEDGDAILWDVRKAAAAETLSGHTGSAFSPQIADDGKTLYTASLDGTVLIWDLSGSRRLGRRFTAGTGDSPRYALSSDGQLLAHGQLDGRVSVVEMPTLTRPQALPRRRGQRDRRAGQGRGHRLPAREPPADRGRHVRLRRRWSTSTAARW